MHHTSQAVAISGDEHHTLESTGHSNPKVTAGTKKINKYKLKRISLNEKVKYQKFG